jgi:hypothetical protein
MKAWQRQADQWRTETADAPETLKGQATVIASVRTARKGWKADAWAAPWQLRQRKTTEHEEMETMKTMVLMTMTMTRTMMKLRV